MNKHLLLAVSGTILLAGCKAPSVNLETGKPIQVNIDMRVDVYDHSSSSATPAKKTDPAEAASPEEKRRNRMMDIQTMKNSHIIGEGRDGLLVIRKDSPGEYGDYVKKAVRDENADRTEQMKQMADNQKIPLPEVQKKQGELWRKLAFKDEWIEVPVPGKTDAWHWIQKGKGKSVPNAAPQSSPSASPLPSASALPPPGA